MTLKLATLSFAFVLALSGCKKEGKVDQKITIPAKLSADKESNQKVLNYLANTLGVNSEEIKFDKLKNSYLIRGYEFNKDTISVQYNRANEYKLKFENKNL